jgi:hypothetical protein
MVREASIMHDLDLKPSAMLNRYCLRQTTGRPNQLPQEYICRVVENVLNVHHLVSGSSARFASRLSATFREWQY